MRKPAFERRATASRQVLQEFKAELAAKEWTLETSLKTSLAEFEKLRDENPPVAYKHKELADRLAGHLIERRVDLTKRKPDPVSYTNVDPAKLLERLLGYLQASNQGILVVSEDERRVLTTESVAVEIDTA